MPRPILTEEQLLEREQRKKQVQKEYYLKHKDRLIAQALSYGKKRDYIHRILYNLYTNGLLRVVDDKDELKDKVLVIPPLDLHVNSPTSD